MYRDTSSLGDTPESTRSRRRRPRTSLRVRNVSDGLVYHLVFEGDVQRLSGRQLRHHLAQISRIPAAEQRLTVRGAAFTDSMLGAAVGLRQEDTLELHRTPAPSHTDAAEGEAVSPRARVPRGPSAVTQSSLRPSTEAGTLTPERPYGAAAQRGSREMEEERRRPSHPHRPTAHPAASVGSTATSTTRMAPSPDRLVVGREGEEEGEGERRGGQNGYAMSGPSVPPPPPAAAAAAAHGPRLPDDRYGHPTPRHDDSALPHWTSATTLSSLPTNYREGEGESPRPHVPAGQKSAAAAAQHHYYRDGEQAYTSPPHGGRSAHHDPYSQRASYEVPSPYDRSRPPPSMQQPRPYPSITPRDAAAGLNHSRRDGPAPLQHNSSSSSRQRQTSPPHLSAPPPPSAHRESMPAAPHAGSSGAAWGGGSPPRLSSPRYVPIRADDLATLLDEQDYIWQMEEYRFRTERLNRLTSLQNRQRELAFEAARYDQAVAEVAAQLSREEQKLAELQGTIALNTAALRVYEAEEGGWRGERGVEGDDMVSEVIDVDI